MMLLLIYGRLPTRGDLKQYLLCLKVGVRPLDAL